MGYSETPQGSPGTPQGSLGLPQEHPGTSRDIQRYPGEYFFILSYPRNWGVSLGILSVAPVHPVDVTNTHSFGVVQPALYGPPNTDLPPQQHFAHPYYSNYAPFHPYKSCPYPFPPPAPDTKPDDLWVKVKYSSILTAFMTAISEKDALKGHANYHHWNEGFTQAMANAGVISHICSEPAPDLEARCIWDRNDAWALLVIAACLHNDVRGLLGPVIDTQGCRRTACMMYKNLCHGCQMAPDLTAALSMQEDILNTHVVNGDILKFITDWSSGLTTLSGFGYAIPWATMLNRFIQHFPTGLCYVLAANKCQKLLKNPLAIPSCIMFDNFAQTLIDA
ncbi:hypothetical protein BT96DRAFT_941700 [Gymnopus androsaceus JB14]|uniref:Uncharacterized protein n=1 Tax=Gymnopus androsaceus JB14 TaxID=1447944 RepID=A0A6A4HFA8_9AGAR|nr:hypothetical protein BT96DRAFT_941700 [Gymnopus androsaceus JB14]